MNLSFLKKIYSQVSHLSKETLSEANGATSFGRVSAAVIIASTITWISYVVFKTHAIPDLSGPSLFLSTGTGATYGANKVAVIISGQKEKGAVVPVPSEEKHV